MFFGRKNKEPSLLETITRPESPKVVRERKSVDVDVITTRSPKTARRERGDVNLHKSIYDQNTGNWQLRYNIENSDYAKGAYGKVLLATDKTTKEKVVIKKIAQTTPIRMINNEVRAGKILGSHPNIAQLYQYIDRPDFHYLVFQYINGQDLFGHLEKLEFAPQDEAKARSIITQICNALKHIHSNNIAHRDIKLENVLIDGAGNVSVIDLGLCAFIEEGKLCRDWCGSDNYLAPEIVRRTPYNGYKADVFSTGVVLFALIFGVFPFENLRVNGASMDPLRSLRKLVPRFPTDVKASEEVKDLLTRMLTDDPEKRCTIDDVLAHDWIVNDNGKSYRASIKESCESVAAV